MRIVSWNINSLRKRQDRLFEWLEQSKPDIVSLQETKCPDEQFPALALQSAGYDSAYHGEKSYNGVAILSNTKLTNVRASLCDEVNDPQARVIAATAGDLRVYSVYAPNGQAVGSPAYKYKLEWYARLANCLKKDSAGVGFMPPKEQSASERRPDARAATVVCGDFNVAPEDADVHDPALWRGAIMCSDAERAAFQKLCHAGFRDTLRLHPQPPGVFTWWDYRMLAFPKNRGLRIDAVLASESLARKCSAAGVDRELRKGKDPSDHAPIWADFEI